MERFGRFLFWLLHPRAFIMVRKFKKNYPRDYDRLLKMTGGA